MPPVLRYVAATKKSAKGTLYLQCHVKPGASKVREGVAAVTDNVVEVCVAAQPRDGESNKAVLEVLCKVHPPLYFSLKVAWTDLLASRLSGCQNPACRLHEEPSPETRLWLWAA